MDTHKLQDIISLADINARYAALIGSSFPNPTSNHYDDKDKFFALQQQNAFFRAVNLTHSLLATKYQNTELRIKPRLERRILGENGIQFKHSTVDLEVGYSKLNDWLAEAYPTFQGHDEVMLSLYDGTDILDEIRVYARRMYGLLVLGAIENDYKSYNFESIRHNVSAHTNVGIASPGILLPIREDLIFNLCKITKTLAIQRHFWLDYVPLNNYEFIMQEAARIIKNR